ncbi:MAG TPA: MFS transporter [Oligoflexus sp.]|uniref:MFS transporter n=1 Tax=Oligoflexus sp. TaxID=1971216 RepID=UPI002D7E1FBD|nr:MFS transporter [Oligoflexus sp.]HET9238935.1 MFS transporter [Oligoflexus sp.]
MSSIPKDAIKKFSPYQKFVVAVLAFLQFTVVLDFMILSPLGAILMPTLNITTSQFGLVVSGYAFSAGASGLLAAGFADRFDRKKLLMFFYIGFILGTLFCGLAPSYEFLLAARIVTGLFGGVVGSVSFAIITDLFPYDMRGRVMGIIQTSFAASQVMGLPFGLYLSNHWGWHAPFILIVIIGIMAGVMIGLRLQPIRDHLKMQHDNNPFVHLFKTVSQRNYLQGFATTALLSTGGFMLMPFASAFNVNNLGVRLDQLPLIYMVTGVISIITGPLVGRLSDRIGKMLIFMMGSTLAIITIAVYTRLSMVSIWTVIAVNTVMWIGVSARMISSSALMSALPKPQDRGAYMSVSSSIQQISGGLAAILAGLIVVAEPSGRLDHFDSLGNVIIASTMITMFLMFMIGKLLKRITHQQQV